MLASTLLGNVPINNRVLGMSPETDGEEFVELRKRWDRLHTLQMSPRGGSDGPEYCTSRWSPTGPAGEGRRAMKTRRAKQSPFRAQVAFGRAAIGAMALAVGATAVGAVAIGALAIRALAVKRGRIGRLEIGELEVDRLRVKELIVEQRHEPEGARV